jgi:hypothetical protein
MPNRRPKIIGLVLAGALAVMWFLAWQKQSPVRDAALPPSDRRVAPASPALPSYTVTGQQGIVRFVVVTPQVAETEANIWAITEALLRQGNRGAVIAIFWSNDADAPRSLAEFESRPEGQTKEIANVSINLRTAHRDLHLMNGHRFAPATRSPR